MYDLWKSWGAIYLLVIPFSLKFFFSTLWFIYKQIRLFGIKKKKPTYAP